MLKVSDLRKEFANVVAVDGVSFEVKRGEVFGLLGPNGAGKTTTIRIVLNIFQADSGQVTYDGAPFSENIRNIAGYLPEERGLYRKQKLFDTILYFAELRGMSPGTARAEANKWLDRFDLLKYKSGRVEELSKGNQQKIQFIISIIHDPVLVILDEPFTGLDPVNQLLLKDILLELRQRGKVIIFSTHQMDQAEKLSDTLCLINKGKVVLGGAVRDVKKRYGKNSLHLEYSGDGSFMNQLPGVRRADVYQNSAELELADHASIQELIQRIILKVELRKFELVEPSLHSIFIDVVGIPEGRGSTAAPSLNLNNEAAR